MSVLILDSDCDRCPCRAFTVGYVFGLSLNSSIVIEHFQCRLQHIAGIVQLNVQLYLERLFIYDYTFNERHAYFHSDIDIYIRTNSYAGNRQRRF